MFAIAYVSSPWLIHVPFPSPSYHNPYDSTKVDMDPASQVLAEGIPADLPQTWAAWSEYGRVPLTTLYCRAHGRPSNKEKARQQQYLTPAEEKALVASLLLMSNLGYPVRVKYIPSLALTRNCPSQCGTHVYVPHRKLR